MALKKYAYYIKGNKIAIAQMSTIDISAEDYGKYKSPTEDVANGIEIEYTYAPWYRIDSTDRDTPPDAVTCHAYGETDDGTTGGFLRLKNDSSQFPWTSSLKYIVIKGSERWNGLHEIHPGDDLASANSANLLTLKTRYTGPDVTDASFLVYDHVSVMEDESFEIDLTRYQANAIVYYIKAKLAEDMGDIEQREYFMRLFTKQLEKGANSRKVGINIIQGFGGMR